MPGTPALDLLESSISDTIARLDRAVSRVEHDPGNIHDEIHLCRETLAARELLDHIGGLIRKYMYKMRDEGDIFCVPKEGHVPKMWYLQEGKE